MSTMTEVIQKARRFIGYDYSQSDTKSACSATTGNHVDGDDAITEADKKTIMAIRKKIHIFMFFLSKNGYRIEVAIVYQNSLTKKC
jgi:hypothetical protein